MLCWMIAVHYIRKSGRMTLERREDRRPEHATYLTDESPHVWLAKANDGEDGEGTFVVLSAVQVPRDDFAGSTIASGGKLGSFAEYARLRGDAVVWTRLA
jgi:hypothetical protein